MKNITVRLLSAAAALLFVSGVIFMIIKLWIYGVLLWAGAFGCVMAAFNFKNKK